MSESREFCSQTSMEPCLHLIHINCRQPVRLTFENTRRKISPDYCKQDYINDIMLNIMEPILSLVMLNPFDVKISFEILGRFILVC